MRLSLALCFLNFVTGLTLGSLIPKEKEVLTYDVHHVQVLKTEKPCYGDFSSRVLVIDQGGTAPENQNCNSESTWSSDLQHVDFEYLCQSPSMMDVKIIESVNWDSSFSIGIGTVDVYYYDEDDNEICHSKSVTNWIKR